MSFKKLSSLALVAVLSSSLAACGDDDNDQNPGNVEPGPGPGEEPGDPNPPADNCDEVVELDGNIDEDLFICASSTVILKGMTYVGNGATITIEAGTTIYGENGSALVITKSGKIVAEGTADAPIVFTSSQEEPVAGDWGGVVLLGNAKINVAGGSNQIEGIDPSEGRGTYGGDDDTHNCGTLAYVRVEYAGYTMGQDNELNGITLGGCGDQTVLHHIQVIDGLDDGIEFFGGKVDLKYALVTNAGDDAVDFDEGYRGNMQFIAVEIQTPNSDDPRGFEWDSLRSDNDASPRATVVMSNATIWQTGPHSDKIGGAKIRRGAGAALSNILIANVSGAFAWDVEESSAAHTTANGVVLASAGTHFVAEPKFNTEEFFSLAQDSNVTFSDASLPIPAADAFASHAVDAPTGSFFVAAKYVGAFDPSKPASEQWTSGWTR